MLELAGNINEEGKLQVYNQALLTEWRLANTGKEVILSIKIKRRSRSNKQNAYYWGVIVPMVTEAIKILGNDFEEAETHEFLKSKFNAKQIEVIEGHYIDMPQSTSKLDTKEFMTFIENIRQFASIMLNTYIPSPNEAMTIDFPENKTQLLK